MKTLPLWATIAGCLVVSAPILAAADRDDAMKITLTAPITSWDEAIPLGNGLLGGLLWGEGGTFPQLTVSQWKTKGAVRDAHTSHTDSVDHTRARPQKPMWRPR